MPTLLLEGPFESDYSLSIVNRNLAGALAQMGISLRLHQRDNTTPYFPKESFLKANGKLAPLFVPSLASISADVHSRIYLSALYRRVQGQGEGGALLWLGGVGLPS